MEDRKITLTYLFLAHHPFSETNRTLEIKVFKKSINICARCTGQYVGLISYVFYAYFNNTIHLMPFFIILLLPLGATVDWITQTLKLRDSNNYLRLFTGFLFGLWLGVAFNSLFNYNVDLLAKLFFQSLAYIVVVLAILFKNRKSLEDYLNVYESFISEYKQQQ